MNDNAAQPPLTSTPATTNAVNKQSNNHVAFRLPQDQATELRRLAALRGESIGKLAQTIVTAAIVDYARFDEISHRLRGVERALEFLVKRSVEAVAVQQTVDELRASLATAAVRLLVETGRSSLDDAIAWTQEAFRVTEEGR